jgi:hypothetical protein
MSLDKAVLHHKEWRSRGRKGCLGDCFRCRKNRLHASAKRILGMISMQRDVLLGAV